MLVYIEGFEGLFRPLERMSPEACISESPMKGALLFREIGRLLPTREQRRCTPGKRYGPALTEILLRGNDSEVFAIKKHRKIRRKINTPGIQSIGCNGVGHYSGNGGRNWHECNHYRH